MCDQDRTLAWNVGPAKLLRETGEAKSSSLIFHFGNYRYWRETVPVCHTGQEQPWFHQRHLQRCFSRNLLLMIRIAAAGKSDKLTPMMVSHAEQEFVESIRLLEEQAAERAFTFSMLDGIDIFDTGVALLYLSACRVHLHEARRSSYSTLETGQRILRLLTITNTSFPAVQSFYDIFSKLVIFHEHQSGGWSDIGPLVARAQVPSSEASIELMGHLLNLSSAATG
jgi:hypothetical protein